MLKISDDILQILSAAKVSGKELYLQGQLDRKMYLDVNKVLEAAGGKWNKKAKCHIFEQEAEYRIDQIILSGEVEIPKDDFGFFPTPPDVVARLMEIAAIEEGMVVLEPSAGKGAIALACVENGASVHCVELMEENFLSLSNAGCFDVVINGDFLTLRENAIPHGHARQYDRVIMNPPFAKQADIKHVMHAHKFLKEGGLLVSVMSAGVQFRSDRLTREFREFVEAHGGDIKPLPDKSFKASGTTVRTVVVAIPA